jgi:hypothetical protein
MMEKPAQATHVLIPFLDDSTLFFALKMRASLRAAGARVSLGWLADGSDITDRQMLLHLPEGPDFLIQKQFFSELDDLNRFDAIVTCRINKSLSELIRRRYFTTLAHRPAIIAFNGGLDFFPEKGFQNRFGCDGIFLFPQSAVQQFRDLAAVQSPESISWQHVDFGHPFAVRPDTGLPSPDLSARRDIYFFTQAISPVSRAGRLHMLAALAAIARRNPDRTVWIKLRHLPGENAQHLHKEKFPYPDLMNALPTPAPANLQLTACTMDEALSKAAIGITCTSTAAIDLVREGIPTMVNLDFVENYLDPLTAPMAALFEGSGLITPLEDMLHLRTRTPNPEWVDRMYCPDDLGPRVLEAIRNFRTAKRIRIQELIPPRL